MNATTVAVDLAKNIFQLAVADAAWKVVELHRLTRSQFERFFANREVDLVIMEACGSAHHWARWLNGLGIQVKLLPPPYVRAYVKRNKADAADACALLEAARASDIIPVRVKSLEQQALQGLHRIRSLWMSTARINALRGFCREFGLAVPQGAACTALLSIPGIGLLTATALVAATGGQVKHFRNARHFASWFGLTPKEYSSGGTRQLGRISKRGDRYLRVLLTHGARSVLRAASLARRSARTLDGLRTWAITVQARTSHNKAACALANKLARICAARRNALRPACAKAAQEDHAHRLRCCRLAS